MEQTAVDNELSGRKIAALEEILSDMAGKPSEGEETSAPASAPAPADDEGLPAGVREQPLGESD